MIVDNAVIMAAGLSSRFEPLCYEKPKGLVQVKGEILIERQIRQLKEVGIDEIYIVVGYKGEQLMYLEKKFDVKIIVNTEYLSRNNNSSIYAARGILKNSYICNQDNYFTKNIFLKEVVKPYFSSVYIQGETDRYCLDYGSDGMINGITKGGKDTYIMRGPALWDRNFSEKFVDILEKNYYEPYIYDLTWERIYMEHVYELALYIRKYNTDVIYEFNTVKELAEFDESYKTYMLDYVN